MGSAARPATRAPCGRDDDLGHSVTAGPTTVGTYVDPATGFALGATRLSIVDLEAAGSRARTRTARCGPHSTVRSTTTRHCGSGCWRPATSLAGIPTPRSCHISTRVRRRAGPRPRGDVRARDLGLASAPAPARPRPLRREAAVLERAATQLRLRVARAGPGLASEPDLDPRALDEFFVFGYARPGSALEGIRQLPAGHLLTWDHERQRIEQRRYWQPPVHGVVTNEPVEELAAEAEARRESIRGRLLADVLLGIFLSGGVDSSLIATLATRQAGSGIKTFTVGYDAGERDERSAARSIASLLGSDHHELTLTSDEAATRPFAAGDLDLQPLGPGHRPPACGRRVRPRRGDRGHRAAGADELFGGYPRYRWLRRAPRSFPAGFRGGSGCRGPGRLTRQRPGAPGRGSRDTTPCPRTSSRLGERGATTCARVALRPRDGSGGRQPRSPPRARRRSQRDRQRLRDRIADAARPAALATRRRSVQRDRAGMLVSLEVRTPYLQRDLAEFAASVPPSCTSPAVASGCCAICSASSNPRAAAPQGGIPAPRGRMATRATEPDPRGPAPARRALPGKVVQTRRRRPVGPAAHRGAGTTGHMSGRCSPRACGWTGIAAALRTDAHARPDTRLPTRPRRNPVARAQARQQCAPRCTAGGHAPNAGIEAFDRESHIENIRRVRILLGPKPLTNLNLNVHGFLVGSASGRRSSSAPTS